MAYNTLWLEVADGLVSVTVLFVATYCIERSDFEHVGAS